MMTVSDLEATSYSTSTTAPDNLGSLSLVRRTIFMNGCMRIHGFAEIPYKTCLVRHLL